ncbi:MAG: replicative DNA helicase [Candidatus Micrarchaeia archaeon]|jgi:replicative DNA helicase
MSERVPPHSQDAEQALLGAMLLDGDRLTLAKVFAIITLSGMFYSAAHRRIFEVIQTLYDSKEPVELVSVCEELERRDILPDCGGRTYIAGLVTGMATSANVEYHAEMILEKYRLRRIIEIASDIVNQGYRQEKTPTELADEASALLTASSFTKERQPVRLISSYLPDLITRIDEVQSKTRKPGIMAGFAKLDEMTVGFQPGELTIIAGRPKNGKTALLNCIATNIAKRREHKILMFSAEMAGGQFALRSMCAEAGLNSVDLRHGRVADKDWEAIARTSAEMDGWAYYIDDRDSIDINALCAEASRARSQGLCDIVFIDYLQLLTSTQKYFSERLMVGAITLSLVRLAKELKIPVVAASQLSRETEKRREPRPKLSDLAESGHIERHADNVFGIFRPELYANKKDKDIGRFTGAAELIVLAQRNGPVGTVDLYFEDKYTRFQELQTTLTEAF